MAIFEVEDATAPAVTSELFGFWATRAPAPAAVSFGTPAADPAAEPVIWRSRLPADPMLAERELAAAEDWQRQREQAFQEALPRMQALLASDGQLSFAAPQQLDPAEQTLLSAVLDASDASADVSFGIGDDIVAGWAAADQHLRRFMQHNLRNIVHAAWIETSIGERLRGRSVIGWGGDTDTVWETQIPATELRLHRRSVDLALGSRLALIRSFGLAGRGAAIVATAVSSPIGPVMALPAAWRFINDLARPRRA